jgi:lipoprotein-anchoring transpeptidase ErfK/SrfK
VLRAALTFVLFAAASASALGACSEPVSQGPKPKPKASAWSDPAVDRINGAEWKPGATPVDGPDPVLIRAQVLLARARFSPGVIDGRDGDNFRRALKAFEAARGLPSDGVLDAASWRSLTLRDSQPVVGRYRITAQDVAGPFTPVPPPSELRKMAKLDRLGYADAAEMLAERYHMDEQALRQLNPSVDFAEAGETIVVAVPGRPDLEAEVARIEIDKGRAAVRAYDAANRLLATYPATVGSTDRPSPSGQMKVNGVAKAPTYQYDPSRLTFGRKKAGGKKLSIAAGPNNPVGAVWIDLSKDTYGIHGTPDPDHVGKTASHGCVRLTNWDAEQLAAAVKPGTTVRFVGRRG